MRDVCIEAHQLLILAEDRSAEARGRFDEATRGGLEENDIPTDIRVSIEAALEESNDSLTRRPRADAPLRRWRPRPPPPLRATLTPPATDRAPAPGRPRPAGRLSTKGTSQRSATSAMQASTRERGSWVLDTQARWTLPASAIVILEDDATGEVGMLEELALVAPAHRLDASADDAPHLRRRERAIDLRDAGADARPMPEPPGRGRLRRVDPREHQDVTLVVVHRRRDGRGLDRARAARRIRGRHRERRVRPHGRRRGRFEGRQRVGHHWRGRPERHRWGLEPHPEDHARSNLRTRADASTRGPAPARRGAAPARGPRTPARPRSAPAPPRRGTARPGPARRGRRARRSRPAAAGDQDQREERGSVRQCHGPHIARPRRALRLGRSARSQASAFRSGQACFT